MTDSAVLRFPLQDDPARDRIARDLDTNLLVEAGAGSGKTTALVERMTGLIVTGRADIEQIAAVTFTRKAAGELRQRFQIRLEEALRDRRERLATGSVEDPESPSSDTQLEIERLGRALENIDTAFIGTIHSFCARLLRERPLAIGLDPGFEELPAEERLELRQRFWTAYLERLIRDSDPILEEISRAGISISLLGGAFDQLVENPDVHFPAEDAAAPTAAEIAPVREELEAMIDAGMELMPEHQPDPEWDPLQKKIRTLHFTRDVTGWREKADLFDALDELCKPGTKGHRITQKRWKDRALAKQFCQRVDQFGVGDTPARALLARWRAHRYGLVIRLAQHAAQAFEAHRLRIGRLDFQDLLVLAARLLREHPSVRRQLGERYRRLLVDEFQDTDPLQAEIVLLLASEPEADDVRGDRPMGGGEGDAAEWRSATPRPGALFVVGDPKQSIYRFRRADIQLYGLVKARFADFGDVLELTTNFRSRPPIGDLVNELFPSDEFFPAEATEEQAAFEPLNTRPGEGPVAAEGVFWYEIAPSRDNQVGAAEDDAARLATWIRARIDGDERAPGDFMILTRRKAPLATYAAALEARGLPVQVTGAGVGAELELSELQLLLECMIDPADPVKVVAVLVGIFFGIDYERLLEHRLDGGSLDVTRPRESGHPDVRAALATLHGWWRASASRPADVFVGERLAELGLLPFAAASDLGSIRAGALRYAMDAVRASALAGDASLPGAVTALRSSLELAEAEAPLEPGRDDVVRLMNLHQAKGLEAKVVILADPSGRREPTPTIHMTRGEDGGARGFLRVTEAQSGFRRDRVVAAPEAWAQKEAAEERFSRAEEVRLLYVAVTRAEDELVVSRWTNGRGVSPWAALDPWLDERGTRLELEARPPGEREGVVLTPDQAEVGARDAGDRIRAMGEPRFLHLTVTDVAKDDDERPAKGRRGPTSRRERAAYKGVSWGSAVHGALAAAAAESATAEGLRATCRDLLVEHGRPLDDHGEPRELTELLDLVRTVRDSELWRRASDAEQRLVEIPFAAPWTVADEPRPPPTPTDDSGRSRRQLDLFGAVDGPELDGVDETPHAQVASPRSQAPDAPVVEAPGEGGAGVPRTILEGVIDLAFRESDGWVIADYKTDVGTDPDFEVRAAGYRRQVELYAQAWSRLTGEPVSERVLFYTAQGRIERW